MLFYYRDMKMYYLLMSLFLMAFELRASTIPFLPPFLCRLLSDVIGNRRIRKESHPPDDSRTQMKSDEQLLQLQLQKDTDLTSHSIGLQKLYLTSERKYKSESSKIVQALEQSCLI